MATIFRRIALLTAAIAAPAAAQGFEDLEALETRIVAALGADVGAPGGPLRPLDGRLKLAACPAPATIEPGPLGAAVVRCEPLGWRIRVPVSRTTVQGGALAAAEPVVRKGDQVEFIARTGSFTVSTVAIAEQDGGRNERIRVRTLGADGRKNAPVLAEVIAAGQVGLPGFK
jgi:flagellar basal body P-ring formation protein FlgA